jgi:hypothetical protein
MEANITSLLWRIINISYCKAKYSNSFLRPEKARPLEKEGSDQVVSADRGDQWGLLVILSGYEYPPLGLHVRT